MIAMKISDAKLIAQTRATARTISGHEAELIVYLQEMDRRKLYSDLGYKSLFDFCTRDLGMCNASAQIRIVAARTSKDVPEVTEMIGQGTLSFTNLSQANSYFKENDIKDPETKLDIIQRVEGKTVSEAQDALIARAEEMGEKVPDRGPGEGLRKISKDLSKVTYVLSKETVELLEEVKGLLGKDLSGDELTKLMATALKEKVLKKKFKQVEKPRMQSKEAVGRVFTAADTREIHKKSKGECEICKSKFNLHKDHIKPYAKGGKTSALNGRLLCGNCNQRARIKEGLHWRGG
jgi:HNH endonuclease